MRYLTFSANAKTCFCALMIALPAALAFPNICCADAQAAEENADEANPILESAVRSFAAAHHQADKSGLDTFYAARNHRPAWTGSREALQRGLEVQATLKKAGEHGLNPSDYAVAPGTNARTSSGADAALYDVAVTDALLRYAHDVQFGRVRPEAVYRDIELPRRTAHGPAALAHALDTKSFDSFLDDLAPEQAGYRGLVRALGHYREVAAAGGWPSGFSANQDDPANRKLLIKRLAAEDTSLVKNPNPSAADLQAAIMRYQSRNGLKADGELGAGTMASLNVPIGSRIQQIAANLQRWRWMPEDFESRYVIVNIPDQTLEFVRDGATVMKSRVMVGKKSTRSPILRTQARSLVVNPPWNVPTDIAARSILPKLKGNPNYLASRNIVFVNGQYRQRPGPNSAMGTLMLDAPNRFDVYLHDTPGKAAFANDDRELSNGCIRVQDMMALASLALAGSKQTERLKDIIATRQTTRLTLDDPLPIYMVYWTAIADSDGNVEFRPDRYGRDPALIKALAGSHDRNSDRDSHDSDRGSDDDQIP
jgi:murein L,D-transpeptidase YcbB/YkuD